MDPELLTVFKLPFAEQQSFFKDKLNIPTRKWDDLWKDQHAKGFMVAGAYKADLLADFRSAVDKAVAKGTTLEKFRKDFDNIVAKHGWSYNGSRNWRSEIIYSTNVRQAYNAGRWAQLTDPEQLEVLPYLTYKHGDSKHPRPHHLAWDGITLPHDDPWWNDHFPQNGWGCKCRVYGSTKKEYEAAKAAGKGEAPPSPIDPATGEPIGIDKGFGFNIGKAWQEQTHDILAGKLASWPADIGAAAMKEMSIPARKVIEENYEAFLAKTITADKPAGEFAMLGALTETEITFLDAKGKKPDSAGLVIGDKIIVGAKAARHELAGDALTDNEWKNLPAAVHPAERVLYDKTDGNILFVMPSEDEPRNIKVTVKTDFYEKKLKQKINSVRSVFKVGASALDDRTRYEVIR